MRARRGGGFEIIKARCVTVTCSGSGVSGSTAAALLCYGFGRSRLSEEEKRAEEQ